MLARASFRNPSLAALLLGALALACGSGKASMKASGEASTEGGAKAKASADKSWEYSDDGIEGVEDVSKDAKVGDATKSAATTPAAQAGPEKETALLGARRDLVLTQGAAATCECLAAIAGKPSNAAFTWNGPMPEIEATSQLVIAVGSEGIPCAKSATGASYQGYREENGDIIVNVEAAHPGRPITHGAIIPRPKAEGHLYVQGVGKIPYGKSLSGAARCMIAVQ